MLKARILMCAIGLAATGTLHAGQPIEVEKLTRAQLAEALRTAHDEDIVEFHGERKTKAEWRSEYKADYKPIDPAKRKAQEHERNARVQARQKELDQEQDSRIDAENARTLAKFDELRSRQAVASGAPSR